MSIEIVPGCPMRVEMQEGRAMLLTDFAPGMPYPQLVQIGLAEFLRECGATQEMLEQAYFELTTAPRAPRKEKP